MQMTKEQVNMFITTAKDQALDALERSLKSEAVRIIERQIKKLRGC